MPDKPRVFVTRTIPEAGPETGLRESCEVEVWPKPLPPRRDILLEKVRGCAGLVTMLSDKVDETVLNAAGDGLRVVAKLRGGLTTTSTSPPVGSAAWPWATRRTC